MQKLFTTLALTLAAASTAVANPVDEEKARQTALDFLPQSASMTLVSQARRNMAKSLGLPKETAATSPYYIYSRGEGQGYVIVAGDDCLPSILGYTESGDFDASNLPPALQDMLDSWALTVEDAQLNGTNHPIATLAATASERTNIAPIMTAHWGQGSPYNDHCPFLTGTTNRALTGCVATAASQILYYWRRDLPSTLQNTTPTYGYGDAPVTESVPKGTPLRWDLMKDRHYTSDSQESKDAVAEFVFATGSATWLTYGASTAGNIENIPYTYSAYFGMNGGTVHYRDSYSQEGWVQLLYSELEKGHPVMYTGVHPDQGGHAVVVHGYQKASDLFYFNFGWDGGGDGYYTVNQETGMNGFNAYQSALIGAYPRTWNMTTEIAAPEVVYAQRTNDFTVKIVNNSTLSKQGFYLFAATSNTTPSSLSSAKSSDTETIIATGDSAVLTLSCKPTSTRTWYITVTDADLNILGKLQVTPEAAAANLSLNSITAVASADTETIDGIEYSKFYNSKAVFDVYMKNNDEMPYEGTGKIDIYVYDEDTNAWTLNGTNSASNIQIGAMTTGNIIFNVSNTASCPLAAGKRYYAEISNPWKNTATTDTINTDNATSTRAYFILTGESDLAVASYEEGSLALSGHWDKAAFETIIKRTAYIQATSYDLTQVESFSDNIDADVFPNPNALIYVSGTGKYQSPNIINEEGTCPNLILTAGYSFRPKAEFNAQWAKLTFADEVGKWYLITTPFSTQLEDGIFARRIDTHKTSGLTSTCTTDVHELEAGHTYLIMASSNVKNAISFAPTSESPTTTVVTQPLENADTALVGTFVATTMPAGIQLINDEATQYFEPTKAETEVPGLRGYFYSSNLTKKFRVNISSGVDPAYITLAESISAAYDILFEYQYEVADAIYQGYYERIQEAEHEFSYREDTELTSASLIKKYASELLSIGEQYKEGTLPTAVAEVLTAPSLPTVQAIYTLSGMRIQQMQKGINILRMSDGTTKKVMIP